MYMNKCCFTGRLGQKPEAKDAKGRAKMELSIAAPRSPKNKDGIDWIDLVVWDKNLIGYLSKYFDKGDEIYVEAHYQNRAILGADGTKKYYKNFVVDSVQKVTWKNSNTPSNNARSDAGEIEVEDLGLTGEIPDFE